MEIITIPLVGALKHRDSMGNEATITAGEIQVMSAGTGIQHSEFNATNGELNLFQIWVFPNKKNVTPRYDQQLLDTAKMKNNFAQILSPNPDDDGVWIHQNAWFHLGEFEQGKTANYALKANNNGVYVFVVEGQITVNGQQLNKRDALGVWDTTDCDIIFNENSKVLLLDVPMEFDY
jgi:redox-sensitive bicupin YhaK (pirin superfamily)